MLLQLIKDYSHKGEISYHIKIDEVYLEDSMRFSIEDALEFYELIKLKYTKNRKEIIIQEEI